MQNRPLITGLLVSLVGVGPMACGGKKGKKNNPPPTPPPTTEIDPHDNDPAMDDIIGADFLSDADKQGLKQWSQSLVMRCSAAAALPSLAAQADEADPTANSRTLFINPGRAWDKLGRSGLVVKDGSFVQLETSNDRIESGDEHLFETMGPLGPLVVTSQVFGGSCLLRITSTEDTKSVVNASYSLSIVSHLELQSSFRASDTVDLVNENVPVQKRPFETPDPRGLTDTYLQLTRSTQQKPWLEQGWAKLVTPKVEPHKELLAEFLGVPQDDVDALVKVAAVPKVPRPLLIAIEGAKDTLPLANDYDIVLPQNSATPLKIQFHLSQEGGRELASGEKTAPTYIIQTELRQFRAIANASTMPTTAIVTASFVGLSIETKTPSPEERSILAKACVQEQLAKAARFFEPYDKATLSYKTASYELLLEPCQAYEWDLAGLIAGDEVLLKNVFKYAFEQRPRTRQEFPSAQGEWVRALSEVLNKRYIKENSYKTFLAPDFQPYFGNRLGVLSEAIAPGGSLHPNMRQGFEKFILQLAFWDGSSSVFGGGECVPLDETPASQADKMLKKLVALAAGFGDLNETFQPVLNALTVQPIVSTTVGPRYLLCLPKVTKSRADEIVSHDPLKVSLRSLRDAVKKLEVRIWPLQMNPADLYSLDPFKVNLSPDWTAALTQRADAQTQLIQRSLAQTEARRAELQPDWLTKEFIISDFQETSILEAWTDSDYADASTLAAQLATLRNPNLPRQGECEAKTGIFVQMYCQGMATAYFPFNAFSKTTYLKPVRKDLMPDIIRLKEKFFDVRGPSTYAVGSFIDTYVDGFWKDCTDDQIRSKHAVIRQQLDESDNVFKDVSRALARTCM